MTPQTAQPIRFIKSWSHSRATDFEKCKFSAFLKYVERVPEPERPLPPGKTEHANDRGSRVHDALEQYTRGKSQDYPREANSFRPEVEALKKLFKAGKAQFEEEWAFDRAWEIAPWASGWLRMKLDALVFLSPYEAVAIDYKTGRKFGKEIAHGEQLMLYQLACFLRYPDLEEVTVELWYLDQDDLTQRKFTRSQGLRFKRSWDERGNAITTATEFPPNPNKFTCQYCPWGAPENGFPDGTGHCLAGKRR